MIDPDAPDPVYLQLAEILRQKITAGELAGRMASERDLAVEYGVSYGSVRRAMVILRERGLIRTIHGRGTFAIPPEM
jgi:GntR family transcriptional regulator